MGVLEANPGSHQQFISFNVIGYLCRGLRSRGRGFVSRGGVGRGRGTFSAGRGGRGSSRGGRGASRGGRGSSRGGRGTFSPRGRVSNRSSITTVAHKL